MVRRDLQDDSNRDQALAKDALAIYQISTQAKPGDSAERLNLAASQNFLVPSGWSRGKRIRALERRILGFV
jgi:hypothetical protein